MRTAPTLGLAARGRKHTDEAKAKMSRALKGRVFSAEWLAKLTLAARRPRKPHSAETRARLSLAAKRWHAAKRAFTLAGPGR